MPAGSVAVPTIIPLKAPQGSKYTINSNTRIEIRSDTPDTVVYYTLNGRRPEHDHHHHRGSHTYTYKTPFALNPGKVTIKALACSKDGLKQSSVVTKTFVVHEATEASDESEDETVSPPGAYRSPSPQPSLSSQLKNRLSMGSRLSLQSASGGEAPSLVSGEQRLPLDRSASAPLSGSMLATGTTASRPPTRDKPKPICVHCNAPRLKTQTYCTHCGSRNAPLPPVPSKPPVQMAACSNCRALLPPDSSVCLVCENTILKPHSLPVIQAQADGLEHMMEKTMCLGCGTANPPHLEVCVTCEGSLFPAEDSQPPTPLSTPPPLPNPTVMRPIAGSSYMMCGLCGRVNVSDARFCDWCGSKPAGSQLSVMCANCSTPNEWHYRYCHSCGGLIKAPLRPEVELASTMKMPVNSELDKNAWVPVVEIEDKGPELRTLGTQTDGLFYPSARTISKQKGVELTKMIIHTNARDRVPKLHSHSPGKGLWRMQVEHICAHLKAHSQSSTEFQDNVKSLQIGKLLKSTVRESGHHELNIQFQFALKEADNNSGGGVLDREGSVTSLRSPSATSLLSTGSTPRHSEKKKKRNKKNRLSSKRGSIPKGTHLLSGGRRRSSLSQTRIVTKETGELLSELAMSGLGRSETVESLIQKGADVNATDSSTGLPVLSMAVAHGHTDCLSLLIESGASLDAQVKSSGNTALHEAVLKGPSRLPCVETLLSHGANARLQNSSGLTACELAMKLKHDTMVASFTNHIGSDLLGSIYKLPNLTL